MRFIALIGQLTAICAGVFLADFATSGIPGHSLLWAIPRGFVFGVVAVAGWGAAWLVLYVVWTAITNKGR